MVTSVYVYFSPIAPPTSPHAGFAFAASQLSSDKRLDTLRHGP
jgi:hypothetical protein